jgi:hypothetical protein
MQALVVLAYFGLPALAALVISDLDRRRARKHEAAWRLAAASLDGKLERTPGVSASLVIVAVKHGVEVRIDHRMTLEGATATRARALTLDVRMSALCIDFVDPTREDGFRVTAAVPARAAAWLDRPLCDALRACPLWQARLASGEVWIEAAGLVTDVEQLRAAVHATAVFVGAEQRFHERWQAAMEALGASGGPQHFETMPGGVRTTLRVDRGGERLRVCIQAALPWVSEDATRRLREDPAWDEILALAPLVATIDRAGVTLELPTGADPDVRQLEQVLALLARLVQGSPSGPYR